MNFRKIFAKGKSAVSGKQFIIMGVVLILLIFILIGTSTIVFLNNAKKIKILRPEQAKIIAEKFINENLLSTGAKATVKSVIDEGDVYNINLNVDGQDYSSYMSKDGSKFFQSGINMATFAAKKASQAIAPADSAKAVAPVAKISQSDKPKVELFIMAYCPYGLQAEKGFLPVMEALGNKVDASIKFVHYFMHGDTEEQETYNQVCIRDEQAAKYDKYLNCFVIENNSAKCVAQAGVDEAKLKSCIATKAKDIYKADSALSNQYGVQGSPTLIINGVPSNAGRDAASYLAGICDAFNTAPAECSKQLSTAAPTAGFGAGSASGASDASCE
ncbi:DsbA family protein [Patescibacteria group bacterium]|nr:DsbA family protein [Patescibacteria group bacterium]MBU1663230.1 DsbA family protein [Patescibacteria group bacterium]MBU1934367.1 DsbA family protein [Patescibacteria group bacterium]MBU2008069.1 DsbA family protein [Patescibacteria group bacterium]MBU2233890.1 DsbA family protein [Patescibacteria group bacterium]